MKKKKAKTRVSRKKFRVRSKTKERRKLVLETVKKGRNLEFKIVQGQRFIACLSLEKLSKKEALLSNFYVTSGSRRKRIGSRLVEKALNYCQANKIKVLGVEASLQSRPLFKRFGFKPAMKNKDIFLLKVDDYFKKLKSQTRKPGK